jgi:hypothetical protein
LSSTQKTAAGNIEIETLSKCNGWPWYVHDYKDEKKIHSLFGAINLSSPILKKRVGDLNSKLAESLHNMTANNSLGRTHSLVGIGKADICWNLCTWTCPSYTTIGQWYDSTILVMLVLPSWLYSYWNLGMFFC